MIAKEFQVSIICQVLFRMCNVESINRALCISTESIAIGNFVCLIHVYFFSIFRSYAFKKCFYVCAVAAVAVATVAVDVVDGVYFAFFPP